MPNQHGCQRWLDLDQASGETGIIGGYECRSFVSSRAEVPFLCRADRDDARLERVAVREIPRKQNAGVLVRLPQSMSGSGHRATLAPPRASRVARVDLAAKGPR